MDLSDIAKKLGLSEPKHLIRKAGELRRLCDVQFDSSIIGVVSLTSIFIQTMKWVSECLVLTEYWVFVCRGRFAKP
jgi:hypothetical protein